jgi:hypothetical protein
MFNSKEVIQGIVLIAIVTVAAVTGIVLYGNYLAANAAQKPEPKTVSVSGTGTVYVTPDIGWFTVSVSTQAETATQTEEQNNNAMSSVIMALTNAGVSAKDIQTTDVSLSPVYQDSGEAGKPPVLVGYQAVHTISVTVNDLTQMGRMLDLAVSNGANEIGGISFGLSVDKEQQAQATALNLAMKDAGTKATTITNAMGARLIGPTSVSIENYYAPTPMALAKAATPEVPVMPGQLQYTVSVQVVYAFA